MAWQAAYETGFSLAGLAEPEPNNTLPVLEAVEREREASSEYGRGPGTHYEACRNQAPNATVAVGSPAPAAAVSTVAVAVRAYQPANP